MNIITIEEQTFKQVCGRFSGFASQVERICKENTRQPDEWLSGREVCALLGISIRSLQNYRDSGKLGYSQIGNKLYYKSADIERLIAECMENKITNYKSNFQSMDRILDGISRLAKENRPHLNGEKFLSNREAAKCLKVSIRTLQEWRDTGVIPYIQIKGKIIYRQSDIERLLQTYYNKERQE